jgi:hypothetical protein
MSDDEREERLIEWPEPREDPPEEPSHRAARIRDRERNVERGDVEDES